MEEKYLDVLSKNILNEVKDNIKRNNIYLEKEKESEIDKKMLEFFENFSKIESRFSEQTFESFSRIYCRILRQDIPSFYQK